MSGLGLNKSRRVSWASDVDLCQFRLFLLEDSPAQVSLGAQDHLQAKTSVLLNSTRVGPAEALPPGFEGSQSHPSHQIQIDVSQIPVIKWTPPPRFLLNLAWQVVSGEESMEVEVQYQRELRVFEAIYPRLSAIPPNASVSSDIDACCTDDDQAPIIPITPIEEEDVSASTLSDAFAASDIPMNSQPFLYTPGKAPLQQSSGSSVSNVKFSQEPDVAAAMSTAFSAIMKNNEQGNLIDHELLTKLLSNPQLIEKLMAGCETAPNLNNMHNQRSLQMAISDSSLPINEDTSMSSFSSSTGDAYPQSLGIGARPTANKQVLPRMNVPVSISLTASVAPSPPVKDLSYYKSLIQQHGEERHENIPHFSNPRVQNPRGNHEMMQSTRLREPKPKIMKPCIFFNSPRGCRNGANCAYQHDEASNGRGNAMPNAHGGKRMKMDRQISS